MSINHNDQSEAVTKRSIWKGHYTSCQSSGLKQAAYCRNMGLVYHQYRYWHRKLELEQTQVEERTPSSGFLPIAIKSPRRMTEILCTLEFSSGARLLVHEESVLKSLFESLG